MRLNKSLLCAALAGCLSASASAHDFNYNWIELSAGSLDSDSAEADSRSLALSLQADSGLLFGAHIGNTEYDELFGAGLTTREQHYEVDSLGFSIGGASHSHDHQNSSWLRLGYTMFEGDSSDPFLDSIDGDALRASAGIRSWFGSAVEGWFSGGFERQDVDVPGAGSDPENSWLVGAGLRFYIAPEVSLGAGVNRQFFDDDDVTSVNGQLRFYF